MKNLASVRIVYSFGRSGSTLLNQCLGCHSDNAILSEVNPARSFVPVTWQASHWLKLLPIQDDAEIDGIPYDEQIAYLARVSEQAGRRLIVRDWTAVNFLSR